MNNNHNNKTEAPLTAIRRTSNETSSELISNYSTKAVTCQPTEAMELVTKFAPKRTDGEKLSQSYARLGETRKAERCSDCGTWLQFSHSVDSNGAIDPHGRLVYANFCRDRLCPLCSWRRTLKIFSQVSKIMTVIEQDYEFLFLTLTVPNCTPEELPHTITKLMKGFDRLMKRKRIKTAVRGFFRALEVTRNSKNDTYHPHFHVILAVGKKYFKGTDYIPQAEWLQTWRDCYGDQSITQVDVRRARGKDGTGDLGSAVSEIAKYSVKSGDYIKSDEAQTDRIVAVLAGALRNRRLTQYGGIFKDVAKALKLDDPEDGDLIHVNDELHPAVAQLVFTYKWSVGCYKIERRELVSLDASQFVDDVPEGSIVLLDLDKPI